MQWLTKIADDIERRNPSGEIVVSSGVSPSGTYHLGTLREVLTAEAIYRELKRRGRQSRHIHVADDLDVFRKVPIEVPTEFEKYLGKPLCDVPAPDGSDRSYADYYLGDLLDAARGLKLEMETMRAHEKYRNGFFVPAIEKALENASTIRQILENVSGRKLDEQWSPVQVIEDGYLKNRRFVSIDTDKKEIKYLNAADKEDTVSYQNGLVKLSWRVDWPARWALLGVKAEPFGRDHATKGGSYDTGVEIVRQVYGSEPPVPLPYEFINKTGETKKMSKSKGDTITAAQLLKLLPAEVVWYFVLRYSPDKILFFDEGATLMRLVDEFSELLAKNNKTEEEKHLLELCTYGVEHQTVSSIPFSHLVASYQSSLHNAEEALKVIARTEHKEAVESQRDIILRELQFIKNWLNESADEDVKFNIERSVEVTLKKYSFTDQQREFLSGLADKLEEAPGGVGGEWFHKAVYEFKDQNGLSPKELFLTLYNVLISKDYGPRAGWFLYILYEIDKDWLIKRLRLEA
jgi:lysyl-tRNA synthetase class 1